MKRIEAAFAKRAEKGDRVLVAYLCAGDPDLETSEELLVMAARSGADLLEVGVPFSDPTADGPVLVRSAARALRAGTTVRKVLALVSRVRRRVDAPIILFGYWNPFLRYGPDALVRDLATAGGDGLLVVDLPPEEATDLCKACRSQAMGLVPLLAPTSTESRIAAAAAVAGGFVYYVSLTGVTGAALGDAAEVARSVRHLRARLSLPVVVGFGVRSPEDARTLGRAADGVVVGTALVERVELAKTAEEASREVASFVSTLRRSLSSIERPSDGAAD